MFRFCWVEKWSQTWWFKIILIWVKRWKMGIKPLLGKSYLIRNHFWVNFGPKRTKIDPIFVRFGSYWMLISMVKIILVIFLHKNGHRNQMMAISGLKTSLFWIVSLTILLGFFVAWTTNMAKIDLSPKKPKHCVLSPWAQADIQFLGR